MLTCFMPHRPRASSIRNISTAVNWARCYIEMQQQ